MRFAEPMDFVQLRDGSSYVGKVTTKALHLQTGLSATPLEIATNNIVWVIFRGGDGSPKDRLQLAAGSDLSGTVVDPTVTFHSDATGEVIIPVPKILAIQFLSTFGNRDD